MRVSPDDRKQVEEAIRSAEARAGAEFVCVLARSTFGYEFYPLAWASILAFALPWLLLLATTWPFADILLAQITFFALAFVLLSLRPIRRYLVPRRAQRAAAHRAAAEQFFIRDLATTPARRGVLLFVSCDERYARILADVGAEAAVPEDRWREAVDLLIAEARQGRHAAGFAAALDRCADALSPSRRPEHSRSDTLPNRFFVLD